MTPEGQGLQLNRLLGDATMALHQGRKPEWLPAIDIEHGSPNQKGEECSVLFAAHLPPDPLSGQAIDKSISFLEYQEKTGFQCSADACELLTDSHAPIWYRAMASMHTTAFSKKGLGGKYAYLYSLTLDWWAKDTYLCDLINVPTGPRSGQKVSVGARFSLGQNMTRDVIEKLKKGVPSKTIAGNKFWDNAAKFQDTFACILVRDLVANGGFKDMKPTNPKLSIPLTVTSFENGHVTKVPQPIQPKDPMVVWVRYSDGQIGKDTEVPDLGKLLHEVHV